MIQIKREKDASRINWVLNHPSVRPWTANTADGALDITPAVENENNYLLMGEHGGCMFFRIMPMVYEVHTNVLETGRGAWTKEFTAAAARWMFINTDCVEILTRVPEGHVAARAATLRAGGRYEFTREKGCLFQDRCVDVAIYALRVQDWLTFAEGLTERGDWFHKRLCEEARRLGITEQAHPPDENHNRYVGAAVEMLLAGQIDKGIFLYNRWALVSRHATVSLAARDPVTVRIDVGYLTLHDGDIELRRMQ